MPIGIIVDCLSVACGGILGSLLKDKLQSSFVLQVNLVLGLASLGMGISSIVLMEQMPAVILSLIIGTIVGIALKLDEKVNSAIRYFQKYHVNSQNDNHLMVTAIVLFCASGTGIYGSLVSGMSGDHSILISKAILDFFTAMIFACTLGRSVSFIAIPQGIIMIILFLFAGIIGPHITPTMINDFKACGGFIMVATGFRMLDVKQFSIVNMVPSMIIVMILSLVWTQYITTML